MKKEKFGFLLFDGLEELDLVGPWEMISTWANTFAGPDVFTIAQQKTPIKCAKSLQLLPDYSFVDCPPLNYLLVPGGVGTRSEVNNPGMIEFIRTQAKDCRYVTSVCTGAFLLQAAGLLQNKKATTHWQSLDRLRAFKDITVLEKRFVHDDNIWTSAGVSAGIDMAFALIADIAGNNVAGKIQTFTEYFPDKKRYIDLTEEKFPAYWYEEVT